MGLVDILSGKFERQVLSKFYTRRNKVFQGIHSDKDRCFIIGNGPSLKKQDLTLLKDEYTFACNYFVLHEQFADINLKYYCICDNKFWPDDVLDPAIVEVLNQYPALPVIADHNVRRVNRKNTHLDPERCYWVKLEFKKPLSKGYISLDPSKWTAHGFSVVFDICLPLAYYMGFRNVYLLGCDCDWGVDTAADFSQAYFYDVKKVQASNPSVEYMQNEIYANLFRSYRIMKDVFESRDAKIYNATHGGKLEVFERVRYEELFD